MTDSIFTDEDILEGGDVLGPEYFAARRFMDGFAKGWTDEHLKPLADEISKAVADQIRDKVWDDFQNYLIGNTEVNVMDHMRRMVHSTVQALLTGQEWALRRYALANSYNAEKVRTAIASYCGDDIAKAEIARLNLKIAELQQDVDRLNRRYA